jgi:hypothetical protein
MSTIYTATIAPLAAASAASEAVRLGRAGVEPREFPAGAVRLLGEQLYRGEMYVRAVAQWLDSRGVPVTEESLAEAREHHYRGEWSTPEHWARAVLVSSNPKATGGLYVASGVWRYLDWERLVQHHGGASFYPGEDGDTVYVFSAGYLLQVRPPSESG